jgi:predicted Zn-dependent protease
MDLATVIAHELGHVLGYADLDAAADDLMAATLPAGQRRLSAVDAVFDAGDW